MVCRICWAGWETYQKMKAALQEIRDTYGQVCKNFDICAHVSCQSSVAAWMIADKALESDHANT